MTDIKCPNCEDHDAAIVNLHREYERRGKELDESVAREERSRRWREDLERWLEESETREAALNDKITMLEEHLCLTEEKLAKTKTALEKLSTAQCFGNGEILGYDLSENPMGREVLARMKYARDTLAELKG